MSGRPVLPIRDLFINSPTYSPEQGIVRFKQGSPAQRFVTDLCDSLPENARVALCTELLHRTLADHPERDTRIRVAVSHLYKAPTEMEKLINHDHAGQLIRILGLELGDFAIGKKGNAIRFTVSDQQITYQLIINYTRPSIITSPQQIEINNISTTALDSPVLRYSGKTEHAGLIDALQEIIFPLINEDHSANCLTATGSTKE